MRKFFVSDKNIIDGTAYISGEDVKHIYKVLRLKNGDSVIINNCSGKEFAGEISYIDKESVHVDIIEELNFQNESKLRIHLFQGFPKSAKMDLIVQKATELGAVEIVPVFTDRVVVKNKGGEEKKIQRWKKIAIEACKQCGRGLIPDVSSPVSFKEAMDRFENMDLKVVPYENERKLGMKEVFNSSDCKDIKNIAIFIGPEGGFSDSEIQAFKDVNSSIVTLGPRILRTETAGFVCISILMYKLGDLGGME